MGMGNPLQKRVNTNMSNSGQYPISIKEKIMPDMKTALHAVLNEWEKDDASLSTSSQPQAEPVKPSHLFKPTVGVSQAAFNYVKDMGAALRKKIANTKAPDKVDYTPRPVQAIKQQIAVRAGIATLTQPPAQPLAQQAQPLTAKQVLETLSIKEAHALYRELQTMFS